MGFIAPALTFNAISGEHERQTFEMLMATPLSTWKIVRGKLGAAMAYVMLLLLGAMPVMSLAFVFGGVSLSQLLAVQVCLLVAGFLATCIGLVCSSLAKRTGRAAILAYGLTLAVSLGPWAAVFMTEIFGLYRGGFSEGTFGMVLAVTPLSTIVLAATDQGAFGYSGTSIPWAEWRNLSQALYIQLWIAMLCLLIAVFRLRKEKITGAAVIMTLLFWGWIGWTVAMPFESFF